MNRKLICRLSAARYDWCRTVAWSCAVVLFVGGLVNRPASWGQPPIAASNKRAQPPKFSPASTANIFFDDVFTKLVGERPADLGTVASSGPAAGAAPGSSATSAESADSEAGGGKGLYPWSPIISASTLESEVKAIKQNMDKNVTTPSEFAGRGHKPVRRDLSILAMLFAIAGEYDGEVRWKEAAPSIRDLFARTAVNAKAGGNAQVYTEAKLRKGELEDILGGSTPPTKETERKAAWAQICDRAPLMQRLEIAYDTKLAPWTASKEELASNKDQARQEAEILAAISEVLIQEGMGDADDGAYKALAVKMKEAALSIVAAIRLDNYEEARASSGVITKMCTECHQGYRG